MSYIGWRFPPLCGGNRQGYSKNDIEAFKGVELIDNLAREICQNSLDAKAKDSTDPVKVVFELKQIPSEGMDVFRGYEKCIQGCRKCWGDKSDPKLKIFLDNAEQMLSRKEIPTLIASDYNTSGAWGSHSGDISSKWMALTSSDGYSVKSSETSGGSWGIGKNAPFACSALSMVFYNTYAFNEGRNEEKNGEKAFVGVGRMATLLNEQNKETQSIGKYQVNNDDAEEWRPIFEDDADDFRDLFPRDEYGTDVIIVGFSQETDWKESITKAVLKNFFVAINENRLIVELKDEGNDININKAKLTQIISSFSNDPELIRTTQLYHAYTSPDLEQKLSILSDNDAEVYIKTDASFKRIIANFRDNGMLISTSMRRLFQRYAAVFIVRGKELSELLRSTEPARHNTWDYKRINGDSPEEKEKRKKARKALKSIDEQLLELIRTQFETPTETSVDAAGVGEYLPDDTECFDSASAGEDILKPKIKIGKVKREKKNQGSVESEGAKGEGSEKRGDVHNHENTPKPTPATPPKVVDSENGEETKPGVVPKKGTKEITTPNLSKQRAFPVNSEQGLYKIVIIPVENHDNLYCSCSAVGENGKSDTLEMEKFNYNGSPINIKDGKAGPIKVDADAPATFYVTFANKEKMVLRLTITEESKR